MMNPVPWLQMTNMISYQGLVRTFPKEPITINMNVKIEHEIIIKADKDVEELLETRSDLF